MAVEVRDESGSKSIGRLWKSVAQSISSCRMYSVGSFVYAKGKEERESKARPSCEYIKIQDSKLREALLRAATHAPVGR